MNWGNFAFPGYFFSHRFKEASDVCRGCYHPERDQSLAFLWNLVLLLHISGAPLYAIFGQFCKCLEWAPHPPCHCRKNWRQKDGEELKKFKILHHLWTISSLQCKILFRTQHQMLSIPTKIGFQTIFFSLSSIHIIIPIWSVENSKRITVEQ